MMFKPRCFMGNNREKRALGEKDLLCGKAGKPFPLHVVFLLFTSFLLLLGAAGCGRGVTYSEEAPVEPTVAGQENGDDELLLGRFTVVNPEMTVYALAVSGSGREILFSSDARALNMLDDRGRLLWEMFFDGNPVAADISSPGDYVAVGTEQGKVFFLSGEGRSIWESALPGEVTRIALSSGGEYLAVAAHDEDEERDMLYFFSKWGQLLWERETAPVADLYLFPWGDLYLVEKREEEKYLLALSEEEVLWEKEIERVSFSGNGRYFAAFNDGELHYYNIRGDSPELMWSCSTEQEADWLGLTESGEHVIVYSTFAGGEENLFFLDREGKLLWKKRIFGGALLEFSREAEKIVASSWQEYSEDFSKVMVIDTEGAILQEVEMASRIEKMALSDAGNILALAGSDGNIFILGISPPSTMRSAGGEVNGESGAMYRPVVQGKPEDEQFVTLYFYDERGRQLLPVNRRVKDSENLLQRAVNELVKGPRRLSGLSRTIPKDTSLEAVLEDNLLYLDLPIELNRLAGSAQAGGMLDSLLLTVSEFSAVGGVSFLLEGEPAETFGTEELPLEQVFSPRRLAESGKILYLPYLSGERYYILPRDLESISGLTGRDDSPEEIVKALLEESRQLFPLLPELRSVRVTAEEIILDWESSFEELFPEEANSEQKALSALLVDALLLTLAENFSPDRLAFQVEGRRWTPPDNYLELHTKLQLPFYINPE